MKPFDEKGLFLPANPRDDLRQLAVRGAGATLLAGGVGLAVQMFATVVLARLLAPADFGVVTMVTSFSLLLMNFGGNGFNEAVIQREEISHELVSNLFWINVAVGIAFTAALASAGSLIALFYRNPLVTRVAVGMSLTILMSSTSVLHLALLRRAMRFSAVSVNDLVARVCSVAVSVMLGWAGWRYWALVWGAVTLPLVTSVGAWWMCRWIPGRPGRVPGTGTMLRFALNTYGRFSVNYFARNGDNLLIGWRFNAQSLGFYKRAYDLFALSAGALVTPLSLVVVSALSRLNRDLGQYRRYLLDALEVVALVGMGLGALLTLVGKDLIRLLLGPGWERTGEIFAYFGPGIGVMMLYCTHGWIHLSIGRADRWLRWGILELVVTSSLFVLGLQRGPEGVAVAWTVSFWALVVPAVWYAGRPIGLSIAPVLAVVWKYLAASLLAAGGTIGIIQMTPFLREMPGPAGAAARIAAILTCFGTAYLGGVVILHKGAGPIYRFAKLLREMIPRARPSGEWALPAGHPWPETVAPRPSECNTHQASTSCCYAGRSSRPMVSILIPAYNAEEWIADTLRSAIAQTWEPKEIIVVDDGSKDQTLALAQKFQSDSVRVVPQKNRGAAAARNLALSLSKGDYIQWLDADDLLAPDKIARQMEVFEQCRNDRILVSSAFGRFMHRNYRAEFKPTVLWQDLSPIEWLLRKMQHNVFMQTATWLVSRELTEAVDPWDTRLLGDDDGEYFCRVLLASDGVRFVPNAKVYYRTPWFNSLGYITQSARKIEAHWLSMQLHISHLRASEDSIRVRNACLQYLQNNLIHFYPERNETLQHMEELAKAMGGTLTPPRLPPKYYWLMTIFGWGVAKRWQRFLPQVRWSVQRYWDKLLFRKDEIARHWLS